jgi:hypothetical protein
MPRDVADWLRIADSVGLALVAIRLSTSGLFRNYRALHAHAVVETILAVVSFWVPLSGLAYAWFFIGTAPLRWILWGGIVLNLYRHTLSSFGSLATAGKWALLIFVGAALIPLAFTVPYDFAHVGPNVSSLPWVLLGEREITAALAFFVLALCAFLSWFLVPIRRNCAYLCMGFGLIFASRSAAIFVRNAVGPKAMATANLITVAISASVFFAWALLLNRDGENRTSFIGRRPSSSEVERSIQRLADVNDQLDKDKKDEARERETSARKWD